MKQRKTTLILAVFLFLAPGSSPAKTLKVPRQFPSISSALEAAGEGDEILVAPGIYRESITLKENVLLRSQGSDEQRSNFSSAARTIIQAGGDRKQIVLGANGAVLDGFSLQAPKRRFETQIEQTAVLIDATSTRILNCIISFLPYTGITIRNPSPQGAPLIENNKIFSNQGNGVSCEQQAAPRLENNSIYRNMGSGVENRSQARPLIRNNTIAENDVDGVMNTNAQPTIVDNRIRENGLNGIGLQQFSKGTIEGNEINGNGQAGIGLRSGAEAEIRHNSIFANMIGVGLMRITRVLIENNAINDNNVGVGLIRCSGGKVFLRSNNLLRNRLISVSPVFGCELIEENNKI